MATCLVTGGAGFIGSHLAEALVADGHRVRVLDKAATQPNLAPLAGRVEVLVGDVRDPAAVAKAVAGVEVVYHLAAMVSVPESVGDPVRCHETNATATLDLLRAAQAAGARRLVYAGSSSAYGDAPEGPIREDRAPVALSPYAAAKLAGEHYCTAFAATTSLETVRLRFFNVFGPRQDPSSPYSGVIARFATALLAGKRPTVHGDGMQSRDFVYVADVADALRRAADTPGVSGQAFNIGRGERQTLWDLLAALNGAMGTNVEPERGPARAGDVRHSQADISAARAALGFDPKTTLAAGLAACVRFYREEGA